MTDFELLAQAAANAANIPSFPLVVELADIGFAAVRNARMQRALAEYEIERTFNRREHCAR